MTVLHQDIGNSRADTTLAVSSQTMSPHVGLVSMMADDGVQKYEDKIVRTIRGMEARTIAKWQKEGWELVSQSQELLQSKLNFRRPKPKPPWKVLGAGAGVLVILGIIIAVNVIVAGGDSPEPTAAAVKPSAQPTETPTPSVTPVVALATDAEVVDAFQTYINERVAAGVVVATTVTDVSFSDRVLRVTFEPAAVGMDDARFESIKLFENLADFVSRAILSSSDRDVRVRTAVDSIETVRADGTPLGTMTIAELVEMNELGE